MSKAKAEKLAEKLSGWLDIDQYETGAIMVYLTTNGDNEMWEGFGDDTDSIAVGEWQPWERYEGRTKATFWKEVCNTLQGHINDGLTTFEVEEG